jgi:dUTP pyrophosphatase
MGSEIVEVQVFVEPGAQAPVQATPGAAGWDLAARIESSLRINPGDRVTVRTGLWLAVPVGFEGQVRPRSGLARAYGVTVANAPGTVDSDYRGEVLVLLVNHGPRAVVVLPGERIAQLVIAPVPQVRLSVVDSVEALGATARGEGGFGSTGRGEVPLSAPAADSVDGQLGLFAAVADRGPMEV